MKFSRILIALILSATMFLTSCSTAWVTIALQDLPVLIQIATGIISLLPGASTDQAAVASISTQATADLNLILALSNDYKASPTPTTLAKVQTAIADVQLNLPQLLAAAHIKDAKLLQQVTSAVNIVLTTVNAIAALLPASTTLSGRAVKSTLPVPSPKDLRRAWAQQVCSEEVSCVSLVK